MEILGIGPLELIFILLIALIVLGPGDMVKTGRTIGRFLIKSLLPQNGTRSKKLLGNYILCIIDLRVRLLWKIY